MDENKVYWKRKSPDNTKSDQKQLATVSDVLPIVLAFIRHKGRVVQYQVMCV